MKTMVKLLHVEGIHPLLQNEDEAIFAICPYEDLRIPGDALLYAYINNLIIGVVKDRLIVRRE